MSGGDLDHYNQAEIHKSKSEYMEAHSILAEILQKISVDKEPSHHALTLLTIVEINVFMGVPKDDVQRNCDKAGQIFDTLGLVGEVTTCDMILADLHLREGNLLVAKALFEKCVKFVGSSEIISYCLERLGNTRRWGDLDGVSSWTTVFLVHCLKSKEKQLRIYKALEFLGDVILSQGKYLRLKTWKG
ncbi:hypothetical protein B0H13DRAFT_1882054 [Mycena leptocephala]|nr:hypothetical protein B0H13DRAFT_1882054 [Mycena leptocephala]